METPGEIPRHGFETLRMSVGEWHFMADQHALDLARFVVAALTPAVTRALPPDWQGDFNPARARRWIEGRDAESVVLLAVGRDSGDPFGVVILFETPQEGSSGIELRVGYIITEKAWGKGLASELVEGLVEWARGQAGITSISAGVGEDNPASSRVLIKNGFQPTPDSSGGEQIYELQLPSSTTR